MVADGPVQVGVLALQGAFAEHLAALRSLGVEAREVRLPAHLEGLSALVIPGGESTTMGLLALEYGLVEPLRNLGATGAIWGTCAGAILLSKEGHGSDPGELRLGLMGLEVERNALGPQVESFRMSLSVPALAREGLGEAPFPSVFIRGPVFRRVTSPEVEVLASLEDGRIVAARQGRHLATSFHPELTSDPRFHQYFLKLAGVGIQQPVPEMG